MAWLMAGLHLRRANEPLLKEPDITPRHNTTVEGLECNHHHVCRHAHKCHCVAKQCLTPSGLQFGIPFPKLRQAMYA